MSELKNDLLLRALMRQPVPRTPGMDHAPGRSIPARISRGPRAGRRLHEPLP